MTEQASGERQTWHKQRMYGAADVVLWAILREDKSVVGSALLEADADLIIALKADRDEARKEREAFRVSHEEMRQSLDEIEADRDRLQQQLLQATGGELGCCELAAESGFWHYRTCPNYKPSEYEAVTLAERRAEAAEADRDALRRRAEEAEALLRYWDEPCAPDDPLSHLDGLISFLDAWDEGMKTPPSVQAELRSWRNRYRAHLAALTAAATREA